MHVIKVHTHTCAYVCYVVLWRACACQWKTTLRLLFNPCAFCSIVVSLTDSLFRRNMSTTSSSSSSGSNKMRAVIVKQPGGVEQMEIGEVERPKLNAEKKEEREEL